MLPVSDICLCQKGQEHINALSHDRVQPCLFQHVCLNKQMPEKLGLLQGYGSFNA